MTAAQLFDSADGEGAGAMKLGADNSVWLRINNVVRADTGQRESVYLGFMRAGGLLTRAAVLDFRDSSYHDLYDFEFSQNANGTVDVFSLSTQDSHIVHKRFGGIDIPVGDLQTGTSTVGQTLITDVDGRVAAGNIGVAGMTAGAASAIGRVLVVDGRVPGSVEYRNRVFTYASGVTYLTWDEVDISRTDFDALTSAVQDSGVSWAIDEAT